MLDWLTTNKQREEFQKLIEYLEPILKEVYLEEGIQALVEFAYFNADSMIKKSGLLEEITCSKGCSFCCNSEIALSSFEASYIFSCIKQFNLPVNYAQLVKLNSVENINDLTFSQRTCPLLTKDKTCGVYERRPLICRIHSVVNNPKYCNFAKYKGRSKMGRIVESYALMMALFSLDIKMDYSIKQPIRLHKVLFDNLDIPKPYQ